MGLLVLARLLHQHKGEMLRFLLSEEKPRQVLDKWVQSHDVFSSPGKTKVSLLGLVTLLEADPGQHPEIAGLSTKGYPQLDLNAPARRTTRSSQNLVPFSTVPVCAKILGFVV